MIRMLSGLTAPVIGGLCGLFKRDGKVSAYRIVLAVTLAVVGWGLWAGWMQWVLFGEGIAAGGLGVGFGTFLARWVMFTYLAIVLLWPLAGKDTDDLACGCITVFLIVCAIGTLGQAVYVHDLFTIPDRTHYKATVSCEHCGASCYARVAIGESWTDWEHVECCRCGIKVSPEKVPEYTESREAWEARVGGTNGAEN